MIDLKTIAENVRLTLGSGQNVPSPCISVCEVPPGDELCRGCLRTLNEIAGWGSLDEAGKRRIWQRIGQRAAERRELSA